jgi:hypothetical protein
MSIGIRSEAVDWADLAEQLGRGERGTTWKLEQARSERCHLRQQLAVELEDRAGEVAAASEPGSMVLSANGDDELAARVAGLDLCECGGCLL